MTNLHRVRDHLWVVLTACVVFWPTRVWAQTADTVAVPLPVPMPVAAPVASASSPIAHAAGLGLVIVAGAGLRQILGEPDVWPRTSDGFVQRLGDQAGFVIVRQSMQATTQHFTGWQPDPRPCRRSITMLLCEASRTLYAQNGNDRLHLNVPLLVGAVSGSAASLFWRPERRQSSQKAQSFVAARISFSIGVPILTRTLRDLRRRDPPR